MSSDDTQTHRKTMRDGRHDFSPFILAAAAAKEADKLDHVHPEDAERASALIHEGRDLKWDIDKAVEELEFAKRCCGDGDSLAKERICAAIDALRRTHKGGDQ